MRRSLAWSAAALVVVACEATAGVYFRSVTKTEGDGAAGSATTVKAWMSGEKGKVEFLESDNPMLEAGSYFLTQDGGATVILVDPEEKTYMKWDMAAMAGAASGAMKMMNLKYSEPKVELLSDEPGGLVAGLPTRHYKVRTSYTTEMKFMGMKHSSSVVSEEDIWATSELVEAALGMWLRKEPPKSGDEQFDAFLAKQMNVIKGFPLKRITVTTTTSNKGKPQVTKMTMEVMELRAMPVPASTFQIPAGYQEVTMPGGGGEDEGGANPFAKLLGNKKKP